MMDTAENDILHKTKEKTRGQYIEFIRFDNSNITLISIIILL